MTLCVGVWFPGLCCFCPGSRPFFIKRRTMHEGYEFVNKHYGLMDWKILDEIQIRPPNIDYDPHSIKNTFDPKTGKGHLLVWAGVSYWIDHYVNGKLKTKYNPHWVEWVKYAPEEG